MPFVLHIFRKISKYILTPVKISSNLYLENHLNNVCANRFSIFKKGVKPLLQDTLKAISDPTRRKILDLLKKGPMSAGEIGEHFEMTGATLSHHLSILKKAGLVDDSKKGTFIYYEINTSVMEDILTWVKGLMGDKKDEI
jgi:DNA-binding transcriptional ArsR family regulator